MSSLQNAVRRVATLQIPRTLASSAPRAAFSSSVRLQKSATETAKDALKSVDRAVSDKLVDGIDIGSTVAQKAKEVTEDVLPGARNTGAASEVGGQAKGKANELSGEAKGKTDELLGGAKGKTDEFLGEGKGKTDELVGEAKGKAHELAGKAKGTAAEAQRKL